MKLFFSEKVKVIIYSLIMLALGITFCAVPEKSLDVIELVFAVALILIGLIYIIGFCFAPEFAKEARILLIGLLSTGLGILVIFVPSTLVLCIGIILGYAGLGRVGLAVDEKIAGDKSWWIELVSGLVVFVLSLTLIILRSTSLAANIVMIFMGSCLILFALFNLILFFALKREMSKIKKLIKNNFNAKVLFDLTGEDTSKDSNDSNKTDTDNFTDFELK